MNIFYDHSHFDYYMVSAIGNYFFVRATQPAYNFLTETRFSADIVLDYTYKFLSNLFSAVEAHFAPQIFQI